LLRRNRTLQFELVERRSENVNLVYSTPFRNARTRSWSSVAALSS
jgi:hypothetical protein